MKKILIVEDDMAIHNIIEEVLKKEGYQTTSAYSGTEALLLLEKEKVDLILLDLMLPAISGEEILQKVTHTPIIVLSAKVSVDDKVKCLSVGANDYMTKPFSARELLARIQVQLRPTENRCPNQNLIYKDLELLDDNRTLLIGKQVVNLTKTEYAILKQLILNHSVVLTKARLLNLISNDTDDCDENSLKVHISNIRKKMRNINNKNYIESVWGIGFKMVDELS